MGHVPRGSPPRETDARTRTSDRRKLAQKPLDTRGRLIEGAGTLRGPMRTLFLLALAAAAHAAPTTAAPATPAAPPAPPPATGVGVAPPAAVEDPYLWLEDVTSDRALAWARARNTTSEGELITACNDQVIE